MRAILNEFYGTDGIHGYGYGQDEDQGQLGAWYVISSIGLFDVAGLTAAQPTFGLGSPLFDRVTIRLNKAYYPGTEFVIETKDNAADNVYVQGYSLNGQPLTGTRLPFADVVKGGKLEVALGSTPR